MYKVIFTPNSHHGTKLNPKDITVKEPEKEKHDTSSKDYETIRKLVMEKDNKKIKKRK